MEANDFSPIDFCDPAAVTQLLREILPANQEDVCEYTLAKLLELNRVFLLRMSEAEPDPDYAEVMRTAAQMATQLEVIILQMPSIWKSLSYLKAEAAKTKEELNRLSNFSLN